MALENLRENFESFWGNVSDGWRHLWHSASNALTRFRPGEATDLPESTEVDDAFYLPTRGWAMLGGDIFEDADRLVIRLELPGMKKDEIQIEASGQTVTVSGEKRFNRETSDGRWRVMQCAYGSFRRAVPLPAAVKADSARASYDNGVLRIELPKAPPGRPEAVHIKVD